MPPTFMPFNGSIASRPTSLTVALKEWAVAVDALSHGETIMLLRKGGIQEQGGKFTIAHPCVWLYPTVEHQKPHLLKLPYADRVTPVPSSWHPDTVKIQAWAAITHGFQVQEATTLEALLPFHIWNATFATERFKWKPKSPLSILLLRVYRLPQPQHLPYQPDYGGCKSWIDLPVERSPVEAAPVLTDTAYLTQVKAIEQVISSDELEAF